MNDIAPTRAAAVPALPTYHFMFDLPSESYIITRIGDGQTLTLPRVEEMYRRSGVVDFHPSPFFITLDDGTLVAVQGEPGHGRFGSKMVTFSNGAKGWMGRMSVHSSQGMFSYDSLKGEGGGILFVSPEDTRITLYDLKHQHQADFHATVVDHSSLERMAQVEANEVEVKDIGGFWEGGHWIDASVLPIIEQRLHDDYAAKADRFDELAHRTLNAGSPRSQFVKGRVGTHEPLLTLKRWEDDGNECQYSEPESVQTFGGASDINELIATHEHVTVYKAQGGYIAHDSKNQEDFYFLDDLKWIIRTVPEFADLEPMAARRCYMIIGYDNRVPHAVRTCDGASGRLYDNVPMDKLDQRLQLDKSNTDLLARILRAMKSDATAPSVLAQFVAHGLIPVGDRPLERPLHDPRPVPVERETIPLDRLGLLRPSGDN